MQVQPECIPCIVTMTVIAIRELGIQGDRAKDLLARILAIPSLRGLTWNVTSPEVLETVMHRIRDATHKIDPFQEVKALQNRRMMAIVPFLKDTLKAAQDPLYTAVKLAVIGNTIDLMMGNRPIDIENSIAERLKDPISDSAYREFRNRLARCRSLVYLGDNAGEIVCDRLLMETIRQTHDVDMVFVVRSVPTLNDATRREAESVGIHETATILENGIDGPCPGTILGRCSQAVRKRIGDADLIISKGGGNFDALEEEEEEIKGKITFMLLSKCTPYCNFFGVGLHQPILAHIPSKNRIGDVRD